MERDVGVLRNREALQVLFSGLQEKKHSNEVLKAARVTIVITNTWGDQLTQKKNNKFILK